ncbi:hypothetical protein [Niabella drilacis]|uniref:hypothetical protein n=1 Tax=Niabella drilacis (strain DSM 25811 / CCM 8410 / CCUG 62505 / LMG 26954 / E90) TaxID=1285928 RepID=UPI00116003AE|nr:hypothetical protein [Niabella drilacis]
MNTKHPGYNQELLNAFDALNDKMLFTFSDAHLDDLKDSKPEYIEADLLLMGNYVKDNYFLHDLIRDKATGPYLATPIQAFKGKDYDAYRKTFENPFDIDALLNDLDDFPEGKLAKQLLKGLLDIPIGAIASQHNFAAMDEKSIALFNKMIPGYNPQMSMNEFINSIWPYSKSLLEDKKEFTELRRFVSSYMNRDDYSFENWGMAFDERIKKSTLGKSYLELIDSILSDNQKKDLYQRFNYAYNMLETFNITQERSGKSIKKFNMNSLNTDALHAWYASFSDYLVTDDKGLQVKAFIVYQLLGLPVKVLSSKDFINYRTLLLGQEETLQTFIKSIQHDLKHSMQLYDRNDPFKNESVKTFKPGHPYFNYFNRFQIIHSEEISFIAFYCDRNSHASFMMYREIELLVAKLNRMLGIDIDGRGEYKMEENDKYNDDEYIRKWIFGNMHFRLLTASKSWGNTICLGFEILDEQ